MIRREGNRCWGNADSRSLPLPQIALLEEVVAMKVEQMASMNPIPISVAKDYVVCEGGERNHQRNLHQAGGGPSPSSGAKTWDSKYGPGMATSQLPTHAQMLAKGAGGVGRSGPVPTSRADNDSDLLWQKLAIQQVCLSVMGRRSSWSFI